MEKKVSSEDVAKKLIRIALASYLTASAVYTSACSGVAPDKFEELSNKDRMELARLLDQGE